MRKISRFFFSNRETKKVNNRDHIFPLFLFWNFFKIAFITFDVRGNDRWNKNWNPIQEKTFCVEIVNRHFLTVSWGDQLKGTSKADVGNLQSHEHLTCDRIGSYLFFFLLLHYWNLFGNNLPLSVQKIRGQVCLGDILLNNKPTCVMCT
jgi:hypothetical protein